MADIFSKYEKKPSFSEEGKVKLDDKFTAYEEKRPERKTADTAQNAREQKIEEKISGRTSVMEDVLGSTGSLRGKNAFEANPVTTMKTAATTMLSGAKSLNLVEERLEAVVSNMAMAAQKGIIDETSLMGWLNTIGIEGQKGWKGERLGRISDMYEYAGVDEWKASAAGLATVVAATGFISQKAVSNYVGKTAQIIKNKTPRIMNEKWLVNQAKAIGSTVDDAVAGVRGQYKNWYLEHGGKVANEFIEKAPEKIRKLLTKVEGLKFQKAVDLYNAAGKKIPSTKYIPEGNVTINMLKQLMDDISSSISEVTWMKPAKLARIYPAMKNKIYAWHAMKDLIREAAGNAGKTSLKALDNMAAPVYNQSRVIKRMVLDPLGNPHKTSQLVSVFKDFGKAGRRKLLNEFVGMNKVMAQALKNMGKFTARQTQKRIAARVAPYAAGALGLTSIGYSLNEMFGD